MKTYELWFVALIADIGFAAGFIWLSLTITFNAFFLDILGTFLGIFGALSLEEIFRTFKSEKDLEQELKRLLEEVLFVAQDFALGTNYFVFNPQWKNLRATEFIDYIGNKSHSKFAHLDTHIEHHNDLVKQNITQALNEKDAKQFVNFIYLLGKKAYEICVFILDDLYPEYLEKLDLGRFEEIYPNKTIEEIQADIHSMWKKRNIR